MQVHLNPERKGQRQTDKQTEYTPSSNGGDIPSHVLCLSLGHGLARDGDLSRGCVPGNSPHAGLGCEICGDGSSHESDCGPSPWTFPACLRVKSMKENMKPHEISLHT